jgi:hypothetical protein
MRFEFEKITSAIYPAYLHLGDYSLALDPKLILSLKESTPDSCLKNLLQTIGGGNRYIVEMITSCIAASDEKSALTKRLHKEIASL